MEFGALQILEATHKNTRITALVCTVGNIKGCPYSLGPGEEKNSVSAQYSKPCYLGHKNQKAYCDGGVSGGK